MCIKFEHISNFDRLVKSSPNKTCCWRLQVCLSDNSKEDGFSSYDALYRCDSRIRCFDLVVWLKMHWKHNHRIPRNGICFASFSSNTCIFLDTLPNMDTLLTMGEGLNNLLLPSSFNHWILEDHSKLIVDRLWHNSHPPRCCLCFEGSSIIIAAKMLNSNNVFQRQSGHLFS